MDTNVMKELLYFKNGLEYYMESMTSNVQHVNNIAPLMETLIMGGEMTAAEAMEKIKNSLLLNVLAMNEVIQGMQNDKES